MGDWRDLMVTKAELVQVAGGSFFDFAFPRLI